VIYQSLVTIEGINFAISTNSQDFSSEVLIQLPSGKTFLVSDSNGGATELAMDLIFGKRPSDAPINLETVERSFDETVV
jgi:hypothetical protein